MRNVTHTSTMTAFLGITGKLWMRQDNLEYLISGVTESVFFGRSRSVFLGNYHKDTKGKLGQYFQYGRYEKVRIYSKKIVPSHRRTP